MRILSAVLSPVIKWLVMKKDNELPWVTRIFRWVALVLGTVLRPGTPSIAILSGSFNDLRPFLPSIRHDAHAARR